MRAAAGAPGGGGAGLPRGADRRLERRRVDAGGSPADRRTPRAGGGGGGGAGRPEACESDFPAGCSRRIRVFFLFFFFFQILKRFRVFFYLFLFFFFRLLSP